MPRKSRRRSRSRRRGGAFGMGTYSQEKMYNLPFASGTNNFISSEMHLKNMGTEGDCALMMGEHELAPKRKADGVSILRSKMRKSDGRLKGKGMKQSAFYSKCFPTIGTPKGNTFLKAKLATFDQEKIDQLNKLANLYKPSASEAAKSNVTLADVKSNIENVIKKYKMIKNLADRAKLLGLEANIEDDCGQFATEGRKKGSGPLICHIDGPNKGKWSCEYDDCAPHCPKHNTYGCATSDFRRGTKGYMDPNVYVDDPEEHYKKLMAVTGGKRRKSRRKRRKSRKKRRKSRRKRKRSRRRRRR